MRFATNNTERIRITNDGKVGIGTATPEQRLHVSQSSGTSALIDGDGNGNNPILHVRDRADTFVSLFEGNRIGDTGAAIAIYHNPATSQETNRTRLNFQMNDDGDNRTTYAQLASFIDDHTDGTEDGNLRISTVENGTLTEQMRINSTGVGIGTDSPQTILHIKGAGDKFRVDASDGTQILQIQEQTGQIADILGPNNKALKINHNSSGNVMIATGGGNVGIGTTSPTARKLEVKDTSSNVGIRLTTGTALDAIIDFGDTDDGDIGRIQYDNNTDKMHFRTNASDRLTIDSSGNINVLTGNIEASGNISGSSVSSSGDILADGDVVAYNSSDMRLKNNLQVIEGALDKIDGINGYEFDWNDKSPGWARQRGHDVGVVAQEVQKIHPEIVEERKNGYLGVDYKRLVPLLIQSVKELKQEIDEIKQKCDCLNK